MESTMTATGAKAAAVKAAAVKAAAVKAAAAKAAATSAAAVNAADDTTADASVNEAGITAPSAFLMLLEARALWEFGASFAAMPFVSGMPQGDGHPVLVLPGLAANDVSTITLRNFLRERGYEPYPWNYGFNFGPRSGVLNGCIEHVREIEQRHGSKVSLLGWSLGGIYAREIAKAIPKLTRSVITLGTPFTGDPKATNAWRLYELVSRQKVADTRSQARERAIATPPTVPTTSLYSKSDGIVAWQCSLNPPGKHLENIEIQASHFGMGLNPMALYAIADRLAQPEGQWKPFAADGTRKWFFKTGSVETSNEAVQAPHKRAAGSRSPSSPSSPSSPRSRTPRSGSPTAAS